MKKLLALLLAFAVIATLFYAFAEFPLQPLPGRICLAWHLEKADAAKEYTTDSWVAWAGVTRWGLVGVNRWDFFAKDNINLTFPWTTHWSIAIPAGTEVYGARINKNYLCPKGTAQACGNFDCADIYLGTYKQPVFRLQLDNFKTGDKADLLLSGYTLNNEVKLGEFELNDTFNDDFQTLFVDNQTLEKRFRFGISGDEEADKALDTEWVGVTVFASDLISLLNGKAGASGAGASTPAQDEWWILES